MTRALPACAAALAFAVLSAAAGADGGFPRKVQQGSLVVGAIGAGSSATFAGRELTPTADGHVVFGVGRDVRGPLQVEVRHADGRRERISIDVVPRDWPVERVDGVPPATVEPPPALAARIAREQARVAAAREADAPRDDFLARFSWPVRGRISGRFGNQRIYNGKPGTPHSGMDIAVPAGTPVRAPAGGVVTFADADLYLTGGTVLLDHGHGVGSNFLHLSRLDVKAGDRVVQGQVIGTAGKSGRASGPHLHWGLTWFSTRLDPLLLPGIEPQENPSSGAP
jgi:murein DD-endopeptidase MepM/ murein hydrolase activator NlpD